MSLIILLEGIQIKHYVYLQVTLRTYVRIIDELCIKNNNGTFIFRIIADYLSREQDSLQLTIMSQQQRQSPTPIIESSIVQNPLVTDHSNQVSSKPSSPKPPRTAEKVVTIDEMIIPNLTQAGTENKTLTLYNYLMHILYFRKTAYETKC